MKSALKIAFFGSSLVSEVWSDAAMYYRGIIKSLAALGHEVTFFEPAANDRQADRDMPDPFWAKVVVYSIADRTIALRHVEWAAKTHDVLINTSGVGVFDDLLEAAILELARSSTRKVFWDVDTSATLARIRERPNDPFRELIPRYDFIFTRGGGAALVAAYRALGARACVPIHNGVDPETHYRVPPRQEFAADLAFLANRIPSREARADDYLFEAAGASACIVTDPWEGIEAFFEPRREILVAARGGELGPLLLATSPSQLRAIGGAAQRRALAHHTYALRAREIEAMFGVRRAGGPWAA